MAITDRINQGLERLSTSPLGMAGLGLLMQPSMSREPINPFQHAVQGMQLGIQNKATQEAVALRRAEYLRNILRYNQEQQAIADAVAERDRQNAALQEYVNSLPPDSEERRLANIMGRDFVKERMQMMMGQNQTGRLPAANIQEYEAARKGGFPGSFMDYMNSKMTRPVSPNYQAIPTAEGMQVFNTRTGLIERTQGLPPAQFNPQLQGEIAGEKERAKGEVQSQQASQAKTPVLGAVNYLAQQFLGDPTTNTPGAIDRLSSGGFMGAKSMAAPVFDRKDLQYFESLQKQLSTQLRAIFRIPGEGTLSDKEQADNNLMLPSVGYDPETNKTIMKNLLEIINIRASQVPGSVIPEASQAPSAPITNEADFQERLRKYVPSNP